MTNKLAIVLPCYNPPLGWEQVVVAGYQELARRLSGPLGLYIVNDGSPNDLSEAVAYIQQSISNFVFINCEQNRGKGAALRTGIAQADAEFFIYTDIDFPYTIDSIWTIFERLEEGNDVVAGVKNQSYYEQTPRIRRWISKLLRFAIKNILGLRISDTQCGLKGFNQKGREQFLATKIDRYLFDLEFIYLASKSQKGLSVTSEAVQLRPGIVFRSMNPKILLQESRNFAKILFRR